MLGAIQVNRSILFGLCLLMLGCGGEETTEESVVAPDAELLDDTEQVEASIDPLMIPEQSLPSCLGSDGAETYPESYGEFCLEFITQELLDTGNTCFYAPDQKDFGCFCKICALKGAEIKCISELCK